MSLNTTVHPPSFLLEWVVVSRSSFGPFFPPENRNCSSKPQQEWRGGETFWQLKATREKSSWGLTQVQPYPIEKQHGQVNKKHTHICLWGKVRTWNKSVSNHLVIKIFQELPSLNHPKLMFVWAITWWKKTANSKTISSSMAVSGSPKRW